MFGIVTKAFVALRQRAEMPEGKLGRLLLYYEERRSCLDFGHTALLTSKFQDEKIMMRVENEHTCQSVIKIHLVQLSAMILYSKECWLKSQLFFGYFGKKIFSVSVIDLTICYASIIT